MEVPFEKPNTLKDQFKEGPQAPQVQELTQEQKEQEKSRLMEQWEQDTPFMQAKAAYDKLQMTLFEQEFLLGARPVTTIPGLLGMELAIREARAKEFMGQYINELTARMEQDKKNQEVSSEETAVDTTK